MKTKSPSAFTLIELLVVVAIISLLLALLLPSLARAKEEAKLTKCLANLHAIGIALASYNAGNKDLMPEGDNWKYGDIDPNSTPFPGKPYASNPWTGGSSTAANPDNRLALCWTDALYIDGDFAQWTDQGGRGIRQNDLGSTYHNGWSQPTCGYGILQCPSHGPTVQFDADDRVNQCYGLSWSAASYFSPELDSSGKIVDPQHPAYLSFARNLTADHIIVAEGNATMSTWPDNGFQYVPPVGVYMVYQRHRRDTRKTTVGQGYAPAGTKLGGTFLMADGHAEWSSMYANYNSNRHVTVPGGGNKAYKTSFATPANGKAPKDIWVQNP